MNKELLENIKKASQKATLDPPSRIWNRLEYKLDRYEFEKKKDRTNKLIYLSSVAAVLILIISLIGVLKQDTYQNNTNTKSTLIIDNYNDLNNKNQVYNVHMLYDIYSKMDSDIKYDFKEIKVRQGIN